MPVNMSVERPAQPVELTAEDRCDRCAARAVVQTQMASGRTLLWCAHHFASYSSALDAIGARIV